MIKIGVLADTHAKNLPDKVWKALADVDLVFHAGDFTRFEDYEVFSRDKKLTAVLGNMDEGHLQGNLKVKEIVMIEDVRIGIMHGFGPPRKVIDNVQEEFKSEKVDAVIFGHSHVAFNEKREGVLYFNPGSPTDTISAPYCSYGILTIDGKNIEGKIIKC